MANVKENFYKPYFYGGIASCIAECITFPIDTLKTRLQLQGQAKDARHIELRYKGMMHCLNRITAEEGFRVLYSGIEPALLRQAVYGALKYGLYYSLFKDVVVGQENESLFTNTACASMSGGMASAIATPADLLKVRMQSQSEKVEAPWKREGISGLWRGVCPTAVRAATVAGAQLPAYDYAKSFFVRNKLLTVDSTCNHLISSIIAGFCACMVSSPCDVVRTRMMDQRKFKTEGVHVYKTAVECFVSTIRNEGPVALWRGFVPAFMRMGPWNIIFFLVYEKLIQF